MLEEGLRFVAEADDLMVEAHWTSGETEHGQRATVKTQPPITLFQ